MLQGKSFPEESQLHSCLMRLKKNNVVLTLQIYGEGKAEILFAIFSESLRKAKWDSQLLLVKSKAFWNGLETEMWASHWLVINKKKGRRIPSLSNMCVEVNPAVCLHSGPHYIVNILLISQWVLQMKIYFFFSVKSGWAKT